ncbi:hypothetical protein TSAR_012213 [Trichomalopsis sarcophagae]|uniref:Uncharacterized protein n=1 Tax=Trichomalopsis sarcophagae TaxID=543379 RepID=A0A232ED75_9HYME|nr:hypothetical protein TSAR_012213 [Trichomalopsis sarcophagae]
MQPSCEPFPSLLYPRFSLVFNKSYVLSTRCELIHEIFGSMYTYNDLIFFLLPDGESHLDSLPLFLCNASRAIFRKYLADSIESICIHG